MQSANKVKFINCNVHFSSFTVVDNSRYANLTRTDAESEVAGGAHEGNAPPESDEEACGVSGKICIQKYRVAER